jgi:hypothetical protein
MEFLSEQSVENYVLFGLIDINNGKNLRKA